MASPEQGVDIILACPFLDRNTKERLIFEVGVHWAAQGPCLLNEMAMWWGLTGKKRCNLPTGKTWNIQDGRSLSGIFPALRPFGIFPHERVWLKPPPNTEMIMFL